MPQNIVYFQLLPGPFTLYHTYLHRFKKCPEGQIKRFSSIIFLKASLSNIINQFRSQNVFHQHNTVSANNIGRRQHTEQQLPPRLYRFIDTSNWYWQYAIKSSSLIMPQHYGATIIQWIQSVAKSQGDCSLRTGRRRKPWIHRGSLLANTHQLAGKPTASCVAQVFHPSIKVLQTWRMMRWDYLIYWNL